MKIYIIIVKYVKQMQIIDNLFYLNIKKYQISYQQMNTTHFSYQQMNMNMKISHFNKEIL